MAMTREYLELVESGIDIALFSDEEFVVGAAAYSINRKEFFRRVDKSLRKVERVWKAWARPATIMEIWSELPSAVKRSRAFAEHLLEIGTGVSRDGDVFAEMWKNFPDLAEALEDAYGKDLNSYVDANGFPLSEWDKKRRVDHIPDAHLKEIISKKLFGGR